MQRRRHALHELAFGVAGVFIVFVVLGLHNFINRRTNPQPSVVTVKPSVTSGITTDADDPEASPTSQLRSTSSILEEEAKANEERMSQLFNGQAQPPTSALNKFQNANSFTPQPVGIPNDPFGEAVRIAERAAVGGQRANTPREWLTLAVHWQAASDLMAQVPAGDPRYLVAQDRVYVYIGNSQVAAEKAANIQGSP
ncbi:MAG: hypothetical protein AAGF24_10125 [Cyanobacteria bacterium P01_H01_bin.121]